MKFAFILAGVILISSFGGFIIGREYESYGYQARITKVFEGAAKKYGETHDPDNYLQREAR